MEWVDQFVKSYLHEETWYFKWFKTATSTPFMNPDTIFIENRYFFTTKIAIRKFDKKIPVSHFFQNSLKSVTNKSAWNVKGIKYLIHAKLLHFDKGPTCGRTFMKKAIGTYLHSTNARQLDDA